MHFLLLVALKDWNLQLLATYHFCCKKSTSYFLVSRSPAVFLRGNEIFFFFPRKNSKCSLAAMVMSNRVDKSGCNLALWEAVQWLLPSIVEKLLNINKTNLANQLSIWQLTKSQTKFLSQYLTKYLTRYLIANMVASQVQPVHFKALPGHLNAMQGKYATKPLCSSWKFQILIHD